jgi:hypothetical protein
MDKQTIQWVATALMRLVVGYVAVKLGKDAVDEGTWSALSEAAAALVIVGLSVYSSIKARKTLLATEPPVVVK